MHTAEPDPVLHLDVPATAVSPPTQLAGRRLRALPLAIAVVVILGGSALFMSGYSMGRQSATQPGTPAFDAGAFVPFWDTYDTINERYAGGEVNRDALIQGAIRGMIESLGDPYSAYMTSDEYRKSLQGISGQFEGIGAEIATQALDGTPGCATLGPDCLLVIADALKGSPAELAGLLAGDLVIEADGVPLDGLTVESARDRIRGPKGSVVRLTVIRGGGAPFVVSITRDVVQSREVVSKALADGSVGYVALRGFSDAATVQLEEALTAHVEAGRKSLILDLRGNPGGYVTAARAIASQFMASGVIFWEQDASGVQVATEAVPGGIATDPAIRIICLIDGGSASASEIVAGALQDSGRATLVGQTSFGKGTVQQWQELSGEGGAFRLTIARWLTPDKRWINGEGLTPDVVVTLPDPLPAGADPTLDKALDLLDSTAFEPALRAAA
ncbi:MAG TPA: S41 family peptidase [Candidatus Limnocylindrales bacterium]|nr:S41 family peptidase [Candidatus Limnocylindrales bacterium]